MSEIQFAFRSMRAKKARFSVLLSSKAVRGALIALVVLLLLSGIWVALSAPVGFVIASLAVVPTMFLIWYAWELRDLAPDVNGPPTIDNICAGDVLGRLPPHPTPRQLAEIVTRLQGGSFFTIRFGIGPNFLTELSSQLPETLPDIWQTALELQPHVQARTIDATVLLAALLLHIPGHDQLLAVLQLDIEEVVAGSAWYQHIKALIIQHEKRPLTGGIGRDWAFGYTPLLQRFGLNMSDSVQSGRLLTRELEAHEQALSQVISQLSTGRRNAVLVGPAGTGKTTLVYTLAERLMTQTANLPASLRYSQVVALNPASLIGQARGRGELENLMQYIFAEAFRAKNIVLFLDDAQLFLQDGTGSVDLSNLLVPVLEGGGLRLILAMDEQRWLQLSQTNPALAQYMNRVNIAPLGQHDTMLVLENQLAALEGRYHVIYMYQAMREAYRLGDRYVQDQSMPGKALALCEAAAQFAENGLVTAHSVQQAVEKNYGVKVASPNGSQERDMLLNLEQLIHQRMINQSRAVGVVAGALRRARAGVRNPDRPIGTFLFLGPTGVGKTELAKSLAAAYFGGEDRLVRLDLNEFGQPSDVDRLIADGATDPNSLTAQISKQPFSVVLLDEIEKAHPNVLNTLLQLLDEGQLRDITNRAVSFRDAIVIATSNAGADRIRAYIEANYELEQFEEQFVNELIDSGTFKPEFLNRFDEIVLFRPLEPEELLQVIELMLISINKTLANQHISVRVADDAKQLLVQAGYDPRLGARPMRRVVQRTVEDIVAKRMLSGMVPAGTIVEITRADVEASLAAAKGES